MVQPADKSVPQTHGQEEEEEKFELVIPEFGLCGGETDEITPAEVKPAENGASAASGAKDCGKEDCCKNTPSQPDTSNAE